MAAVLAALNCAVFAPVAAAEVPASGSPPAASPADATQPGPVSPTASGPATLDPEAAFREFRQRFDAGSYEAALPYAQRVLELAEQSAKQPTAEEVQVALMNVAMTQQLMGDNVAAEQSYLRAIELIEASGRPLQARQARAHAGLASSYHSEKRYEAAVVNFERAIGLTRRHEGLLSEQQVPLLEQYVDSLTKLGRYQEALSGQRYVLRIAARKHGNNGIGLAPTLESIGRWHAEVGDYDQARRMLKRAIELIESAEGENSARLISPLASLAACNRKQLTDPSLQLFDAQDPERVSMFREPGVAPAAYSPGMLIGEAEKSLLRAARIAEERKDASPVQVAAVRTQVGDWYQSRNQPERALPNYRLAWAAATRAIGSLVQGKPLVEALFGRPLLLQVVQPEGWNRYGGRSPEQVEIRNVEIAFTVDAKGRVASPEIVDDSGDARRAEKTVDTLEDTARYRPRLANGEPVATPAVKFSQPWIVLLPETPETPETDEKGQVPAQPAAPAQEDAPKAGSQDGMSAAAREDDASS